MNINDGWIPVSTAVFWGEIAPCEHVVQIYEEDEAFINALGGYVAAGLRSGECCVVIATDVHLAALDRRLQDLGLAVGALIRSRDYLPLNAHKILSAFMVDNWPDEELFNGVISGILDTARDGNRKVRAFGEMVAVLWEQRLYGATVHLEHLWTKICERQPLSLFCAYPKSGFTKDIKQSIEGICRCHTRMVAGVKTSLEEVMYKNVI